MVHECPVYLIFCVLCAVYYLLCVLALSHPLCIPLTNTSFPGVGQGEDPEAEHGQPDQEGNLHHEGKVSAVPIVECRLYCVHNVRVLVCWTNSNSSS